MSGSLCLGSRTKALSVSLAPIESCSLWEAAGGQEGSAPQRAQRYSLGDLCIHLCGFNFFNLEPTVLLGPGVRRELLGRWYSPSEPSRRPDLRPLAQSSPVSSGSRVPGCSEARLGSGHGPGRPRHAQALCLA